MYSGRYEDSDTVRPRYRHVLIPPSGHYDADIETQDERQRYQIAVCIAIRHHGLERLLLFVVQQYSVDARQGVVDEEEERQIDPDEFVNARSPSETNRM